MKQPTEKDIQKFIENRCSEEEHDNMLIYLHTLSDDNLKKFMDLHLSEIDSADLSEFPQYNDNFSGLLERIKSGDNNYPALRSRRKRPYYAVAAAIIFLMIVSVSALYYLGLFNKANNSEQWFVKETVAGQKSRITLLDGTAITLNADSRLKVPKSFRENRREVYLEGEAYFDVAHDSSSPFIVHSGNFNVTVLGTVFDIKAFANENKYQVSLVKGKVKVTNDSGNNEIFLKPDEQYVFNYESGKSSVGNFDYLQATGWKDNILIFNNTPLKEVFVQLQRAYGIKFTLLDKSSENLKIKANFQNDSFWTIVKTLKAVTGLKYKTAGDSNELKEIIFYKS